MRNIEKNIAETTSFGAIHLKVSNLEKAKLFWTKIGGLKQRSSNKDTIEFGSEKKTLVVVHNSAKKSFVKGYSGLYHFAIHVPNEAELANVINRLNQRGYPYAPTDHTMSKAIYLQDFEGITVEFTLETPERITGNQSLIGGSKQLDVKSIMHSLEEDNIDKIIDDRSFIGHVHLYAKDVDKSNEFYKQIGFVQNKYKPQMVFADLGAGGAFGHRIAMNAWHGPNKPLAPTDVAGLDYFQLIYNDKELLNQVVKNLVDYKETPEGFWTKDPTGNRILLN